MSYFRPVSVQPLGRSPKSVASKRVASSWVKKTYGERWSLLISKAENWNHGDEMNETSDVLKFIKFVVGEVE